MVHNTNEVVNLFVVTRSVSQRRKFDIFHSVFDNADMAVFTPLRVALEWI